MVKIRIETSPLATSNISGVGNYTKLLVEALYSNNEVALNLDHFDFLNRQPQPQINSKIKSTGNKLIPLKVYAKLQSYGAAYPFDLFKSPVDLTIFTNFATWPTKNSKLRGVVVHDLTYLYFPELVEDKNLAHLKRVVPRSIKEADIIITVSDAVKQEIIKEFGVNPEKFVTTPIPTSKSFSEPNPTDVFKKYKIKTKKYIYFMGTMEPRKDLPTLIKAYTLLPKKIKDQHSLVISGGIGWKSQASQNALKKAIDTGEKVQHLGYIDNADSNALYQNASLFVSASVYEGFGMPVLESIVSNTPTVLSDIPVFKEVGGEISLYAKPGHPEDFANKIEEALTSKEFKHNFKQNRESHLEKFSWENNVNTLLKKTRELL